jgi:hypothetical protein
MTSMPVVLFFVGACLIIIGMGALFGWPGVVIGVGVVPCAIALMDAAGLPPGRMKEK